MAEGGAVGNSLGKGRAGLVLGGVGWKKEEDGLYCRGWSCRECGLRGIFWKKH